MTAQIPDTIIYEGDKYELIGMAGGDLISPEQFGMEPEMISTACYRGYYATYELTDEGLYLRELTLHERNQKYVAIDGVIPEEGEHEATYRGLSIHVPFSGKLRLAKDFIRDLYIHMGFQKPTAFRTVYDVTLEEGSIVALVDRSKEMEEKRGAFKERYETEDLVRRIGDAFSLDMDLE